MDDSIHELDDPIFVNIALALGLRFPVVCTRHLVQLWDLGINANSSIGSSAVACTVLKGGKECTGALSVP